MQHDPQKFLYDMLDSAKFLIDFTKGRTLEDYHGDRGFRSAVERELQIIGEALFRLNALNPAVAQRISEHARVIGFRHVLVHGYDSLDHDVVWAIVQTKLAILRGEAETLLRELDEG